MEKSKIGEWMQLREESCALAHQIVNKRNQLSYVSGMKLSEKNIPVSSQEMMYEIYSEILNFSKKLDGIHQEMMDILKQMDDQLLESEDSENPPQNTSLDPRLYRKIIHGMQQQHLLEVSLRNRLLDESSDQDLLTTILTCYSRSPYLPKTDIQMILNT